MLHKLKSIFARLSALAAAWLLVIGVAIPVVVPSQASASTGQLTSRSLSMSSSAVGTIFKDAEGNSVTAGHGGNGQKTEHTFTFTFFNNGTSSNIGSILFEYCTSPIFAVSCSPPTGLDATHVASIQTQTINAVPAGFSLDTSTDLRGGPYNCDSSSGNDPGTGRTNCIAIKRVAASVNTNLVGIFAFGGQPADYITNPTAANCSGNDNCPFYARITTYSDNAFTTIVDQGAVAASTAQQIDITAKVQEVLNFSVGVDNTNGDGGTAVCNPFTDNGAITLGDSNGVLSFTNAYDAHSYFRVTSNSLHGTTVYYSGDTLKSGLNTITAAGTTATWSTVGAKQFGLALDQTDNTHAAVYNLSALAPLTGPPTDYSNGGGTITNHGTATFAFDTGSQTAPVAIAQSPAGVACETGSVRYIGNISSSTPAGIYYTTITYIATGVY